MLMPIRRIAAAAGILLAAASIAHATEPSTLGFQVRGSLPASGLADAAGGGNAPGVGASFLFEDDLSEYFEGWRARGALGWDGWFVNNLTKAPGTAGRVTAFHITAEAVRMLRPGGDPVTTGPYVTAGLGLYEWSYSKNDPTLGRVDYQVGHAVGTLGFGWRWTSSLDLELKALMGKLDPTTTAVALQVGVTVRF